MARLPPIPALPPARNTALPSTTTRRSCSTSRRSGDLIPRETAPAPCIVRRRRAGAATRHDRLAKIREGAPGDPLARNDGAALSAPPAPSRPPGFDQPLQQVVRRSLKSPDLRPASWRGRRTGGNPRVPSHQASSFTPCGGWTSNGSTRARGLVPVHVGSQRDRLAGADGCAAWQGRRRSLARRRASNGGSASSFW